MTCKDCIHGNICKNEQYFDWSYDCRDFKDKSKFIELPCKIGEKTYKIDAISCVECKCDDILECITRGCPQTIKCHTFSCDDISRFGKIVFLTKEEAEKALKGASKND